MSVLVDVGNARLKWAVLGEDALTGFGQANLGADPASAVAALRARVGAPQQVWIANVAGAHVGQLLTDAFGPVAQFARTQPALGGVTCGYRDPRSLGVDRWLALVAGYLRVRDTVCVVDAGTALTVDAADAQGRHYGGLILPGLRLMGESLQQRTSDIGPTGAGTAPPAGLDLFGRSTDEAVSRAAQAASAALVDRCVRRLADAGTPPVLLVTGGDGETLMPWLESPCRFEPHLVLEGLACLASAKGA